MPRNPESFQRNPEEYSDKKEGEFKESEQLKKDNLVERFNRTEHAAFSKINKFIQDKKWDEAIIEILKIEPRQSRRLFFDKIISRQVYAGEFEKAKQLTEKLEDEELIIKRLRSIGNAQARAGHMGDSAASFDEVKQLIRKLEDKILRISQLRYVGSEQAKIGLIDEAKKTAEELRIESGKEDGYLAEVYGYIAKAEAERGQIKSAKEYAALIKKINGYGEDSVYEAIVEAELNVGLVDDAKKTTKEIFNYKTQNKVEWKIRSVEEKAKKLRRGPYR